VAYGVGDHATIAAFGLVGFITGSTITHRMLLDDDETNDSFDKAFKWASVGLGAGAVIGALIALRD
jgi:hypothetical protein